MVPPSPVEVSQLRSCIRSPPGCWEKRIHIGSIQRRNTFFRYGILGFDWNDIDSWCFHCFGKKYPHKESKFQFRVQMVRPFFFSHLVGFEDVETKFLSKSFSKWCSKGALSCGESSFTPMTSSLQVCWGVQNDGNKQARVVVVQSTTSPSCSKVHMPKTPICQGVSPHLETKRNKCLLSNKKTNGPLES